MHDETEESANVACVVVGDKIELVMSGSNTEPHVLTLTIENAVDLIGILSQATIVAARNIPEDDDA